MKKIEKEIKQIKEIILFQHKLNTTPDLDHDEMGAIIARAGLFEDRKKLDEMINKLQ